MTDKEIQQHQSQIIEKRLTSIEQKINRIERAVLVTRRIIVFRTIFGITIIVLLILGAIFVVPPFLNDLLNQLFPLEIQNQILPELPILNKLLK